MNIGSGFLGQSSNRSITPQTMGDIFGADLVKNATNSIVSSGMQSMGNKSLENLRQAGVMQSNQFNFEKDMYRDQQTLLGNKLEFDRQFDKEGRRIADLTAQRKIETDAATDLRKLEADDRFKRDKEEFDRRIKEQENSANRLKQPETEKAQKTIEGTIAGINSVWDTQDKTVSWELDEDTDEIDSYDPDTDQPIMVKRSKAQRLMNEHRARILGGMKDLKDPAAQAAYLQRVQTEGLLDFNKVRGMYDPVFKKQEEERLAKEKTAPASAAGLGSN
jgi:hypothetical protein